jgi:type IV pilus assembly protein PilB
MPMMTKPKRIGDLLVEAGVLSEENLQKALQQQKHLKMKLGDVLISQNYITEQQLIEVLEFQLGIPHVQLFRQKIDPKIVHLVPQKLAEQHVLLPLRAEGNQLVVAMADPLDYFALDELRMITGYRISPVIASKAELERAIKRFYGLQESVDQIMQNLQGQEDRDTNALPPDDEHSPVVKTVNQIIVQAVQIGASDIHLDPQDDGLRIRYRVDGIMRTEQSLPPHMQSVILARIKIMANLDVAERRMPQDGRVEMTVDYRRVDIRISILPTIHGEKVVMRILDPKASLKDLDRLDLSASNYRKFEQAITSAYGIVLITGPTGSGKTTTLYSALNRLNSEEVNIITVEDPVEYQLHGINQVQVNPAAGVTFASGLRSILRQDPNIIMVGEIRDAETAEIAVRAAMTGHLVLSTLHTNSAVNAVTRLIDMGVEPFLIASALTCVVAQRLVRRVCPHCAVDVPVREEERSLLAEYGFQMDTMKRGKGCAECARTGYRGRMGIHEVLVADETLRSMIMRRRSDSEYRRHAVDQGMTVMFADGLEKVRQGLTTLEEIMRAAGRQG